MEVHSRFMFYEKNNHILKIILYALRTRTIQDGASATKNDGPYENSLARVNYKTFYKSSYMSFKVAE